MSRFSDIDIPIDCPSCGRKIKKRLSQLGNGRSIHCSCGQRITVQGSGFSSFKRNLDQLDRTLKRFGKQ